jgi:hypothetical protein
MNDSANHDPTTAMNDGCNDLEAARRRKDFFNEVSDEQLEAAASDSLVIHCSLCLSILLTSAHCG